MYSAKKRTQQTKKSANGNKDFPSPRRRIHFALGAVNALDLYFKRGKEALDLLIKNQLDPALIKLNERDIAYQQFLSLDHLAKEAGQDITQDQSVVDMWVKIKSINDELYRILKTHGEVNSRDLTLHESQIQSLNQSKTDTPSSKKARHLRIVKSN